VQKLLSRLKPLWRVILTIMMVTMLVKSLDPAIVYAAVLGTRSFPAGTLAPGQTFDVTVTFAAPANDFNSIGLTDFAPAGWAVTVDNTFSTPASDAVIATGNKAELMWFINSYTQGTNFTAVYKVTVPVGATAGTYSFSNGKIEYYIVSSVQPLTDIGGSSQVTVAPVPTVSGIVPATGTTAGGTPVTITGTGFVSPATVTIGGAMATGVTVVSATSITATTPAGTAGPQNVVVTNPDMQTGTLAGGFTYIALPAVNLSLIPAAATAIVGSTFDVIIQADAGALGVAGVDAFLNFDATKLAVVDMDSTTPGIQITSGTALNMPLANLCDNATGTITYGAGKLSAPFPNGTFTVATIKFQALAVTTPTTGVSFATSGATKTSVTDGVNDVTGTLIGGIYTVSNVTVTAITPNSGPVAGGTAVTITGTNFDASATISIGGNPATGVIFVNTTTLTATTPAGTAGAKDVVVTAAGGSGALAGGFTYTTPPPVPTVTGIVLTYGPTAGGTNVTITGNGFVNGATVTIGGTPATNVIVVNDTTITATTPAGTAGARDVIVTTPNGSGTLPNGFHYTDAPAPTVMAITPASGTTAGGTVVSITGTGFVSGATVKIGGTAATAVVFVNETTITAATPAGTSGAMDVTVTNPDTQSGNLPAGFTYIALAPAPTVTGIAPATGPTAGGTAVTITGTDFAAGATVKIDGVAATGVTVVSATSITATTPAGSAGAKDVMVTNPDMQSGTLPGGFTYIAPPPAPTVTGISPASGTTLGGTAVTITGTSFVSGAMVTIGGTAATGVTVVNATTITATTPAGAAGAKDVVVTTPDGSGTLTGGFTYINFYTLTGAVNPVAGGAIALNPVQPAGGYASGTVVTLTATPNAGYGFTGWSGDLTVTTNPATITMNGNKSVTGNFSNLFPRPLNTGWNIISTPIKLDANSNTLDKILDITSFEIAYRWDSVNTIWVPLTTATPYAVNPLEAFYVKIKVATTANFVASQNPLSPPVRDLKQGYNLIGAAPPFEVVAFKEMPVNQALISVVLTPAGLRGYTMVISPPLNQAGWVYTVGADNPPNMSPFIGFWVFMENDDTLAGFSTTPIPNPVQ
jgi:hypothetical protein